MFFVGLFIGFLISFFFLKHQIQKDGPGQLKICQSCPFCNKVNAICQSCPFCNKVNASVEESAQDDGE